VRFLRGTGSLLREISIRRVLVNRRFDRLCSLRAWDIRPEDPKLTFWLTLVGYCGGKVAPESPGREQEIA